MSLAAVLKATRDIVRLTLRLQPLECDCQGQPMPATGMFNQIYASIYPWTWSPGESSNMEGPGGIEFEYGIAVCITKKVGITPLDTRFDSVFLNSINGFETQLSAVTLAIHQSQDLMAAANLLIAPKPYPIITTLAWIGCDPAPIDRQGDWIGSRTTGTVAQSMETRFAKCTRPIGYDPSLGALYGED